MLEKKISILLLLTAFVAMLLADEIKEIRLDKLLNDYLPNYKIEKQIQLKGIGKDFAVAKNTGEIVAITEVGDNFKVYCFDKEYHLKWKKDFSGKGYEMHCFISNDGAAIVITNYISEKVENIVLNNEGNILFHKRLKSIELIPLPNGKYFYEKIGIMANREKGLFIYDRNGDEIELTGFDFSVEKDIRLEFLNDNQIISYMDTKFVFFQFDNGHFEQVWDYVLSGKQDLDDYFPKSLKHTPDHILVQGFVANSKSFLFNYEGILEYEDNSFQSASFINNSNVFLGRREFNDAFIKILNLNNNDFLKFNYPFNLNQDFSNVYILDSKYFINLKGPDVMDEIKTVVLDIEELEPIFSLKERIQIMDSKIMIFKVSLDSELLIIEEKGR